MLHLKGPGWQLKCVGNGVRRGMVIQGRISVQPGQNPAYRPSAHIYQIEAPAAPFLSVIGLCREGAGTTWREV